MRARVAAKRTLKGEKFTELILEVLRLWGELESHGTRLTRPFGQTPSRWQVLGGADEGPRTVSQIARRMGLTRQGVQKVAHVLVRERLIELVPNPDHRRSPILRLTGRGKAVLERINAAQAVWSNEVAEGLRLPDLEAAVLAIREVTGRLKAAVGDGGPIDPRRH